MGMTWRFTMPLLSTLAALVIIVHSAEEEAERNSRYEIRPRYTDTRITNYEQGWRGAEPVMQQADRADTWNTDPQDPLPVRRRLGRKRKRRPPAEDVDDVTPRNIYTNDDDDDDETPTNNYEAPSEDNVDVPRRRRKKIKYRPNRYKVNSHDDDVPQRRRLQNRKRPFLDNRPTLSEYGNVDDSKDKHPPDVKKEDENYDDEEKGISHERVIIGHEKDKNIENEDEYVENKEIKLYVSRPETKIERDEENKYVTTEDNKSLSEFSMEVMNKDHKKDENVQHAQVVTTEDKPAVLYNVGNTKEQQKIDPQTLKDILKKSNGTSLSEILQQHNLSLADLLSGKENAISVLRSHELSKATKNSMTLDVKPNETNHKTRHNGKTSSNIERNTKVKENKYNNEDMPKVSSIPESKSEKSDNKILKKDVSLDEKEETIVDDQKYLNQNSHTDTFVTPRAQSDLQNVLRNTNSTSVILANRRFSGGVRRKLRMRPVLGNNYKSQLNRDLIALSARRYVHHSRRNATKAREWKDMIPLMPNITEEIVVTNDNITTTTTLVPEETTTTDDIEDLMPNIDTTISDNDVHDQTVTTNTEEIETTTLMLEILESEMPSNFTERPKLRPMVRTFNASGLRRQAYNNRLKKKRLQHRTSTTEPPPNEVMKNFLSMGDFVSSSEFIARTQLPRFTVPADIGETITELEDFMTTETVSQTSIDHKSDRVYPHRLSTVTDIPITTTSEETAKIEIEEILNDTRTSAKLSKILRERNMTLSELLEHRERGSSHVHLADIFHNASREPNPPEPFLTKSLLEPISKETYPLRALLDANLHDTTIKSTTVEPSAPLTNHVTIPITMAFGNNVNENAENMGIMSLFNNFTKDREPDENTMLQKDSEGTPYKSTIINVNTTDDDSDARESRMMNDDQDMISWNEIFTMIRKRHNNDSAELDHSNTEAPILTKQRKMTLETDADGDGLIVLEDLQHVSEPDTNAASGSMEKIEYNSYESGEAHDQNVLSGLPSNAKSVTVTTASLVGLAMILFLLTYSALKWKQQRALNSKNNYNDERIPTPVFENRKVKKNCSSRSISPMLPTSNIYTMNTLESQNGKDSPEYMWDTLRKPFQ